MPERGVPAPIETARKRRITRALANPVYFAEMYVRPYDPNWVTTMADFAKEMLAFAVREPKAVVMLPPEFMKTTLLSQALPLWLTIRWTIEGKMLRGLLLSEEENMAQGNLNVIAWHILNNERIAADFIDSQGRQLIVPDDSESVWREDAIIVRRAGASKDPTWQAKGLDSKGIHGRRLDWVIGDDVITPRNATSPALRKRALDTLDLQVRTRIVAHGRILLAGNFNDNKDLLHTMAGRKGWATFKRPSMHRKGQPNVAPKESELATAELLWPDVWPRQRLIDIYEETPNRFRRIHLMDPRAEHGERLNVEWVQLIEPEETPLRYCRFYIGIDPAPGGDSDDLDFFNLTCVALHDQHLDLIETFDVRADTGRQAQLVGLMHDRYQRLGLGVVCIGGAKIAMDRYFRGAVGIMRPDLKVKLEEISIPEAQAAKEIRLEGLGAYAQSKWLRVWETVWDTTTSGPTDEHQEPTLMEQWRDFPYTGHDDKLDGLDIAIRTALEFSLVRDVECDLTAA